MTDAALIPGAGTVMRVKAVLFDLDGTLVNTGPDLAHAVNLMLRDLDMPGYPENRVLTWIGNGAPRLIKRALTNSTEGEPDPDLYERAHALFHEHYLRGVSAHSEPYPDVIEALTDLKARGFGLACVTNKPAIFTHPLLEELELNGFFDYVVSGDSLPKKKPDPMQLHYVCQQLSIPEREAVLVGDSVNDIRAAKAAGMPVVCVSYGYNQGVDLTKSGPDAIIDSFRELSELVAFPD